MHHGAGSSGLSFAACAGEIRKIIPKAGILSIDARDHGSTAVTHASGEDGDEGIELDLSLETLNRDLVFVVRETQTQMGWENLPDLVLVGHSLGGAVITDVARQGELGSKVLAYAVLDVVEGKPAFTSSHQANYKQRRTKILTARTRIRHGRPPKHGNLSHDPPISLPIHHFGNRMAVSDQATTPSTLIYLIKLSSTRSRTIRNKTSARVSVPSLLYEDPNSPDPTKPWIWRTNLSATKPFWENWFVGLSRKFLDARGGKLLLLAGTDRLDKELMIGQMQGAYTPPSYSSYLLRLLLKLCWVDDMLISISAGKYQLQVLPEAGHFIQEDQPAKTAQILVDFYKRNDRSALVLPPKVADLQASAAMKKGAGSGAGAGAGGLFKKI